MTDKKVSSILKEIGSYPDLSQDEINDLRYILAHILGTEKARLILHMDQELSMEEYKNWQKSFHRLVFEKVPVHYIINTKNFMGLDFFVDERVLIPRFDTEILVDTTLEEIKKIQPNLDEDIEILELCTGSGAIPISVIHHTKGTNIKALDISLPALQVAKINREELLTLEEQERLTFIQSDLFENVELPGVNSSFQGYHLILANPPYVTAEEYSTLDEKVKKEPLNALVAEDEGIFFYDKILAEGKKYLHPKGGTMIFEIGSQQGPALLALAKAKGYQECTIIPDYAGHARVALIR